MPREPSSVVINALTSAREIASTNTRDSPVSTGSFVNSSGSKSPLVAPMIAMHGMFLSLR